MMNKNLGRNEKCWCGSGKKFKKCHSDRSSQKPVNSWDSVAKNKKEFHLKKCSTTPPLSDECNGKIISAHTISKSANLTKIARNGKVYGVNTDITETDLNVKLKLIGVKSASVFNGFCQKHDRELFSCIENESFSGRIDQCLAIAYRTLSRELYGKIASKHISDVISDLDKGKDISAQFQIQFMAKLHKESVAASINELKITHEILNKAISKKDGKILYSKIFKFDETLPIMFSGAWSPFSDLYGNSIQNHSASGKIPAEQIFFSSFNTKESAFICISWVPKENSPGQLIVNQLLTLPTEQQIGVILQFVLKHVENIFFSPNWFEDLSKDHKIQIDTLMASGISDFGAPASAILKNEMLFSLPKPTLIFDAPEGI